MSDREAVRDAARYLRAVRPIDPEEIREYVEGRPHPGVVRQLLREEAVDLGLVERSDGTFEPVSEEPVTPAPAPVDRFPRRYEDVLEDLLVERLGADWARGETGDRLRTAIRQLKEDYYRGRPVEYDGTVALGYALYHLPDYYAAMRTVAAGLAREGLLDRRLRVLDVGAGVGGPALGLFDALGEECLLDYRALEPSAAATVLETMLEDAPRNVHATVDRTTVEDATLEGPYDLVLAANVLIELDEPAAVLERCLSALATDGTLVALAPADRATATHLRSVERAIVDDGPATAYGPEVRLWPGRVPTDEGWGFASAPAIATPALQSRLDEAATGAEHHYGEFVKTEVRYAPSILRRDGRERYSFDPDPDRWAPLGDSEAHVSDRLDCVAVRLSEDLADDGHPLVRVGDGSQAVDHFAVLVNETSLNGDLRQASYGDLLTLEGALVLWNDDEGAINLVVDEETVVDRIPPSA